MTVGSGADGVNRYAEFWGNLELLTAKFEDLCTRKWPARVRMLPEDRDRMLSGAVCGGTQIAFVLTGRTNPGGGIESFSAGEAFVIAPATGARLSRCVGVELLVLRCAGTVPVELEYFDGSPGTAAASVTICPTPFAGAFGPDWRAALHVGKRVEHLKLGGGDSDPAIAQGVAEAALDLLKGFRHRLQPPKGSEAPPRVACATLYVSARLTDSSLRKADVGTHLGVSESLLTLLFRRSGGVGLREHMILQRLERARQLLTETRSTVYEIAVDLGVTYQHFIRTFRARYGVSPLRFRKLSRAYAAGDHSDNFYATTGFEELSSAGEPPQALDTAADPVLILISNTSPGTVTLMEVNGAGPSGSTLVQLAPGGRVFMFAWPGTHWAGQANGNGAGKEYRIPAQNSHVMVR